MSSKTRYVVIASLLVLTVGLGTGLLAYYVGFPTSAFSQQGGPEELRFVPSDTSLLAYANVHEIMTSDVHQRVQALLPMKDDGRREFETQTGINIETDIDHVVVAVTPVNDTTGTRPGSALVLARGRFDEVKIEALMREHGATIEEYNSQRVIVGGGDGQTQHPVSLAFLEPGLVAVGTSALVRGAVDLKIGGASVATNDEIMGMVRDLDSGNAWAVGRFDVLASQAQLPAGIRQSLPAIQWFSTSVHVDGGVRGVVRAEARDEEAANGLRDVVRGVMGLAKLQAPSQPALDTLLKSLEVGGTGKTVAFSFDVPPDAIEALSTLAQSLHRGRRPGP